MTLLTYILGDGCFYGGVLEMLVMWGGKTIQVCGNNIKEDNQDPNQRFKFSR